MNDCFEIASAIISGNYKSLVDKIEESCKSSSRNPDEVQLLAVTKKIDVNSVKLLPGIGLNHIAENRVQHAQAKIEELAGLGLDWQLIGHLQGNKVKKAVNLFSRIHSVDSEQLLEKIDLEAAAIGKTQELLLQVNVSEEQAKHGFELNKVKNVVEKASMYHNIVVLGLMTMAPNLEDAQLARPYFRSLRELRDELRSAGHANVRELSMGMSGDYQVAIEEGATIIRIGSALFKGLSPIFW